MHLLLGDPQDVCGQGVLDALLARDCETRVIADPLSYSSRFSWWLDNACSESALGSDDQVPVRDGDIAGVLILGTGWIDPAGWEPKDLMYMQAERLAALLAWLWSLRCPVVNRYPPAVWYQPQAPLATWHGLLRRSGLPMLETVVTNVEREARAFGRQLATEGPGGAIYGALTSEARYLVTTEEDWSGLAALQRVTPVSLTAPHGEAQPVCVVGERVVWEGDPSGDLVQLEPAMRSFAAAAGLAFVELVVARTASRLCVAGIETRPHLEHFGETAQQQIIEAIVHLLTGRSS